MEFMVGDKFEIIGLDDIYMLVRFDNVIGLVDQETGETLGDDFTWVSKGDEITTTTIDKLFGNWEWAKLI